MELIEALEKLSLHVKSNQRRYHGESVSNLSQADFVGSLSHSMSQDDLQCSSIVRDRYHFYQLHQFEDSIETLFSQINDLDHSNQETTNAYQKQSSGTAAANKHHSLRKTFTCAGGSLENSQEEDSDNSSQQSNNGYAASKCDSDQLSEVNYSTNCLVVSLMKRDISSITDSVRRICRILALGSEIESIYKNYFLNSKAAIITSSPFVQHVNPHTCRALCESFLELCSSEPYVCDLPTVVRFSRQCQLLMQRINQTLGVSEPETAQLDNSDNLGSVHDCDENKILSEYDEDNRMCLDDARDALDCALLECDQRQLDDNWTDNKLYIDSDSRY